MSWGHYSCDLVQNNDELSAQHHFQKHGPPGLGSTRTHCRRALRHAAMDRMRVAVEMRRPLSLATAPCTPSSHAALGAPETPPKVARHAPATEACSRLCDTMLTDVGTDPMQGVKCVDAGTDAQPLEDRQGGEKENAMDFIYEAATSMLDGKPGMFVGAGTSPTLARS